MNWQDPDTSGACERHVRESMEREGYELSCGGHPCCACYEEMYRLLGGRTASATRLLTSPDRGELRYETNDTACCDVVVKLFGPDGRRNCGNPLPCSRHRARPLRRTVVASVPNDVLATFAAARKAVAPIIAREKEGESIGNIPNVLLRSEARCRVSCGYEGRDIQCELPEAHGGYHEADSAYWRQSQDQLNGYTKPMDHRIYPIRTSPSMLIDAMAKDILNHEQQPVEGHDHGEYADGCRAR
jgi:hypothetical protein